MDLSVILPAYNEEEVIKSTILKIVEFFKNQALTYEIIVVNDGSTDKTAKIVLELNYPNVRLINQENLGKGGAVRTGMLASQGDYLLFLDADYSTSINNLTKFLATIKNQQADVVIASRALADSIVDVHQNKIKEYLGKIGNQLIRLLLIKGINDTQCGFKLFNRKCLELFKKQKVFGWGFDFEILFLAQKFGYKIVQLPVIWQDKPDSKVKINGYLKTFKDLLLIKYFDLLNKY